MHYVILVPIVAILVAFIIFMGGHVVTDLFKKVTRPFEYSDLIFRLDKEKKQHEVVFIHYGLFKLYRIDVLKEIPDFNEELKKVDDHDFTKYAATVGIHSQGSNYDGPVIDQEIICSSLMSAYITARVMQYVLCKKIEKDVVYYRITKI